MEPAKCELLVHINAPSRANDDKRYISISKAVQDFRPAIITRVSALPPSTAAGLDEGSTAVTIRSSRLTVPRPQTAPERSSIAGTARISATRNRRLRSHSSPSSIDTTLSAPNLCVTRKLNDRVTASKVQLSLSPCSHPSQSPNEAWSSEAPAASLGRQTKKSRMDGGNVIGTDHDRFELTDNLEGYPAWSFQTPKKGLVRPRASAADDSSSTQTVSPWDPVRDGGQVIKDPENPTSRVSLVDLTTPDHVSFSVLTPSSRAAFAKSLSTTTPLVPSNLEISSQSQAVGKRHLYEEVRALHQPLIQQSELFTTCVTKHLQLFEPALGHFQPAFFARDVKVLERGCWDFWVQIEQENTVDRSRRLARPRLKLLGSTERSNVDSAGTHSVKGGIDALWTEEEFNKVWERVSTFIRRGRAGPDTWLEKESDRKGRWRIRLFSWGEILPHTWFLLFSLSDRLTGKMAMDWMAADGQAIVQMVPGVNLAGKWERRGPPGARGSFGFTQG